MNEVKKSSFVNEMYEDLKRMRIERKIDRILDSLSEFSSLIRGGSGSGAGTGIRGAGSAIGRGAAGSGAGTGIRGAGTPSRPRSEDFDMDSPDHDHESYIEDNPPDEGKQSLSVSARPYDHPIKASSSLSVEQGFAFMKDEFTSDEGISKVSDEYTDDDENADWQDSEYDDGPAEEINSQKIDNEINTVPNQNAAELHDDIEDEMLGEMIDSAIEEKLSHGTKVGLIVGGGAVAGTAIGHGVNHLVGRYKCSHIKNPDKRKECIKTYTLHGPFDNDSKKASKKASTNEMKADTAERIKAGAIAGGLTLAAVGGMSYLRIKDKCKKFEGEARKKCVKSLWLRGKRHNEGLQGPGGKFGFMGEEGNKGSMGEDSNSSEEK
jgi:hypothetical protein